MKGTDQRSQSEGGGRDADTHRAGGQVQRQVWCVLGGAPHPALPLPAACPSRPARPLRTQNHSRTHLEYQRVLAFIFINIGNPG